MEQEAPLYDKARNVLERSILFGDLDRSTIEGILDECELVQWKRGETIDPEIGMKSRCM
jgi:hypothetical protein